MNRLLVLALALFAFEIHSQTLSKKQSELPIKKTSDFEITGEGNSPVWSTTQWIPLVNRNGSADYSTKIKLLYSATGLYFLFSCDDKKITATLTEEFADLFDEDVVEVFLWPDAKEPIYFEYEISPLNYELPILVPNVEGKLFGWLPWHYEGPRKTRHATKIIKDENEIVIQWTAEFFIPFALLQPLRNTPPKKGSQWRANFYRIDYDNDTTYWSWQPFQNNFHDFEMFGTLKFD